MVQRKRSYINANVGITYLVKNVQADRMSLAIYFYQDQL